MADVRRYEILKFDDVVEPGTAVRDGTTVEVSVLAAPPELARRVLDFFSGVAFTGDGRMTRISRGIFRIAPAGVVDLRAGGTSHSAAGDPVDALAHIPGGATGLSAIGSLPARRP